MNKLKSPRYLGAVLAFASLLAGTSFGAPNAPLFRVAGRTDTTHTTLQASRLLPTAERETDAITPLDATSFATARSVKIGDHVTIPLSSDEATEGVVNLIVADGPVLRVSGMLSDDPASTFFVNVGEQHVSGIIQRVAKGLANKIEFNEAGDLVMKEVKLGQVLCEKFPEAGAADASAATTTTTAAVGAAVPVYNSRPSAVAQIYLDFDGETVTDPDWNNGRTIVAASYNFSASTIDAIFNRVAGDYAPFDINITTDVNKYNSAPVGRRMRCIITPTDTAASGSGGVAYVNSFSQSGTYFSSTIPCWVFNSSVTGVSEAISHEVGHTLGLSHDGRNLPSGHEEYFEGQGTGPTSWAPIMGASYYKSVTQWSKGEYQYANNTEDDLALISRSTNGFGYVADEAGNSMGAATALPVSSGSVDYRGVVINATDQDFYSFTTSGGNLSLNVSSDAYAPDLDVKLTLVNSLGAVVSVSNPAQDLTSGLTTSLAAGTYYLKIEGDGDGSPLTTGYSNYASIGTYHITGSIPSSVVVAAPPTVRTDSASSIGNTSAVINGSITADGGAATDGYYFEWGTSTTFDRFVDNTGITASAGSFSTTLTGLQPGTTYYFRAMAHNSSATDLGRGVGWGQGAIVSFVTTNTTGTATLTVLANPSSAGVVSGGGVYPVGSTQTISASANTGWSFTGWSDGNAMASRTILVPAGGVSVTANFSATSNDMFSGSQPLFGASGTVSQNNLYATLESGEPAHAGVLCGASVWFDWTAPVDGQAVFDTLQSNFDTVLAVYTGNSVDALTAVASNDDYGSGTQSRVSFTAKAGVRYRIAVAGYHSATGTIVLAYNQATSTAFTVTLSADPSYGGSVTGGGSFATGATINVTATPARRYRFRYWLENGVVVSYSPTYSFNVTADRNLVASFRHR